MRPTTQQKHSPNVRDNRTPENKEVSQQECWANFAATFMTTDGRSFLQPGQFLPIWSSAGNRQWRCKTPFTLTVISAFVVGGRYMIKGGDKKLSSHPLIEEWGDAPISGAASELRFPGGLRRIHVSNTPALVANAGNFETARVSAKAFHDNFAGAQLRTGCPIVIACRYDKCNNDAIGFQHPAMDVVRGEALTVFELPFPMITSDEEEVVLKDYSAKWTNAIKDYCDMMGVTEIGVLYSADDSDEVTEDISSERPNLVYRNVINKGDLGFSTLDPNLYERMLPFASGRLDVDLLTGN